VHARQVKLVGVIAASAAIGFGAVAIAATEPAGSSVANPTMQTGATATPTTPATAPEIASAVPLKKGPAPLPSEEQGLPG
jgi:hypothetical protein